ncbi:hypothetical protein [Pseudoxanthomonas sp.]|uniref:hypothetical protein n=1 Tax=Pseudoxanthomonas sp. TaxID=1871049 RepID=UPI0026191F53|nr:hypothetical protein [Pseudoxanthomonas sp.]WDS36578.1 MAG: hypothetical protein O8I58_01230 [Pseudoxanthomonas sp.]
MSLLARFQKILNPEVHNESAVSRGLPFVGSSNGKGLRDFAPMRRSQLGAARVSLQGPRRLGRDSGIIPVAGVKFP